MQGLNGNSSMGNVFNGQGQVKVQAAAPKIVNVSSGVAVGMLVQKTAPVYPQIARTAGVSGTVVLDAFISKSGSIEDLRVVSGPVMLRKAAQDAVRTWRYRPYKLNNEPVEVETTINVIFSLNG
jgi:periplasmic protein TonB